MQDLLLMCLYAAGLLILIVFLSSELVAEHTDAQIPKALLYGSENVRAGTGRGSLIVTLLWEGGLLGGSQLIVLLMLVHPASTLGVRLVAAVELVAVAAWLWYLRRLVSRAG